MLLIQVLQNSLNLLRVAASAIPLIIPFTFFLWSLTLLAEKKKLPRTKEDFGQLAMDLREFGMMNLMVLGVLTAQIFLVSLVVGLLGVKI